ncbi:MULTISPECIES: hypothetical protein [Limosilactobacillus]|uniref:Uncharacterized protein n=2 Tax=Limosilactobacillus TaxID=2742598 RepID=A0A839GVR0_9LACO|nr:MULTISPECIES: hypothetical protein [Limosilactobacillus]MRH47310.1 hypothetical protein [Limosilactobacillus reuteri]MBB1122505.1 hypothetical protein [Limosilactobacillus albertensis]MCD7121473.1 hypothetical protein [Limosilactobacillus albertensis]MCD7125485.1 hypothetical protein [Limosilactobacillus caviae]GGI64308.1 hypothetical protein GCM10011459_21420 [Limosilactobacillus caviae]
MKYTEENFNEKWQQFLIKFYKEFDTEENQETIQNFIKQNEVDLEDIGLAYEHLYQQQREDNIVRNAIFYFISDLDMENFNKEWDDFIKNFNNKFESEDNQEVIRNFAKKNSPNNEDYSLVYEHLYQQQRTDKLLKLALLHFNNLEM